jgi:hypothetical protein
MGCHKGRNRKVCRTLEGGRKSPAPTSQPENPAPVQDKYANGDVQCAGWKDRIDISVCIVRGIRQPQRCSAASCKLNL